MDTRPRFSSSSRYLVIRSFFLASACPTQSKRSFSASVQHAIDDETEALYTSASFYPSNHAPAPPKFVTLTAAEEEWLQEDLLEPSSSIPQYHFSPEIRKERVDWRLRAPSRIPKHPMPPNSETRKKYPKRKEPVAERLTQGDPFYDSVTKYEER